MLPQHRFFCAFESNALRALAVLSDVSGACAVCVNLGVRTLYVLSKEAGALGVCGRVGFNAVARLSARVQCDVTRD